MAKPRYAVIVSVVLQGASEIEETIMGVHSAAFPAQKQREHIIKKASETGFISSSVFPFEYQVKRPNNKFFLHNTASGVYMAVSVVPERDNTGNVLWIAPDWVA